MLLTIRSVQFLSLPVSLTSGEYPLLTSATQDLTSYVLAEYTMNYPVDLQLTLIAPDFALWETCNMVRINDVIGSMYWVVGAEMVTSNQKAIRFALSYCGPSSLIHKNDTAVGLFSRLPENKCPWLQRQAITSALEHTRTVALPHIADHGEYSVFWLQVTGLKSDGTYRRLGYFVCANEDGDITKRIACKYLSSSLLDGEYPSMNEIITDPQGYTGFTASQIIDISISCRCPWKVYNSDSVYMLAANLESGYVTPTEIMSGSGSVYAYNLDGMFSVEGAEPLTYSASVKISLSTLERASGTITIRDENAASIGTIPTAYGDSITASISVISDWTGIITYVTYGGYRVAIPEGHIPWSGTAWSEYRAYSLAYDRGAMQASINFSNERVSTQLAQAAASTIQSAAMGAIGGNVAGAATGAISGATSFAISAWATMKESDISTREAQMTQTLAERRVAGQPATPYNAGYGMLYCQQCLISPASIWIEMPANLTASIDDDYTACFGYPAEGLRSVTFGEGYYKGMLYATSKLKGPRFDKLNQTLQNGFRFKEV